MKYRFSITILLISGLLWSCVDEIPLPEGEGQQHKLVVEGRAVKGSPSRVFVQLSRTADLSIQGVPSFIVEADVRLRNETGQSIPLFHQNRGYYEAELTPDSPIDLQTGQSYQLQITLPDESRYESDWEPLPPVPEIDSIGFTELNKRTVNDGGNIVTTPFVEYNITTPLVAEGQTEPTPLLWEAEAVFRLYESQTLLFPKFCYVSEVVANESIHVFSETTSGQSELARYPVLQNEIDWRYATGFYLTLYQYSLSRGAARYWSQVDQIIERDGGLYEKPPGPVTGNIRNLDDPDEPVLGYFFASAVDTSRQFIAPEDLSIAIPLYCETNFGEGGDVCFDCLRWPRSTTERPDYW